MLIRVRGLTWYVENCILFQIVLVKSKHASTNTRVAVLVVLFETIQIVRIDDEWRHI
jgi:hypothetical protein